eukprot:3586024-Rhodomonas_salina.2
MLLENRPINGPSSSSGALPATGVRYQVILRGHNVQTPNLLNKRAPACRPTASLETRHHATAIP